MRWGTPRPTTGDPAGVDPVELSARLNRHDRAGPLPTGELERWMLDTGVVGLDEAAELGDLALALLLVEVPAGAEEQRPEAVCPSRSAATISASAIGKPAVCRGS